jgi:predicted dehydrogenase
VTLSVGFLGAGFISRTHSYFLKQCPVDHRVVAVHDPDAGRAGALAERCGAVAVSEAELLDRVDVAFVLAWTSEHERLVAEAARRGVAVFCEKPLGGDAPTARRMVEAVETAAVPSQVGLVLRSLPQVVYARHLLADARAGRPMTVVFRDDQFIPIHGHYDSTWRVDPARCGRGTLLEHSIHDVDVLGHLLGEVASVSGVVRELHGHPLIDDLAVARLEFAGGAVAALTSIWHDLLDRPSQRHVEIFCERLQITLDGTPDGPLTWQFADEPRSSLQGEELFAACLDAGLGRVGDRLATPGGVMFNPLTPFLEAVAAGTPPPTPLREALGAHEVVDAIYASADAGGIPARITPTEG